LSAFIHVQLSHPYSTAGKIIVCTNLTFVFVETLESFIIFVNFAIAALPKRILLCTTALFLFFYFSYLRTIPLIFHPFLTRGGK
jgi:hypothetical protein